MAFTYTDRNLKTVLHSWGRFRVTLLEAVQPGDALSWYNTDASYTVQFADQSDSQRADCFACQEGAAGDEIWAALAVELKSASTVGTGGAVTQVYFAASTDFFGASLYLGESGKPSSTAGSTYYQVIGQLLARDRILLSVALAPTDDQGDLSVTGRITFNEDAGRTGEGVHLFANGLSIGMATPGDCQGVKMEFDYGVTPTLTGSGKGIHGLDIKMTMDQEWNFTSADRNATVRGARIQGWSQDDVGGKVMGIYSNARAEGTSKTVEGIIGGTDDGPGVVSLEARTELGTSATITTPAVVGLEVWHNSKTGSTLTGDYRAICIHQPLMPTITGTTYGIWFGDDHNTGYPYDYAIGFSSELDLNQIAHYSTDMTASGMSFSTVDGYIKIEIDGTALYLYAWDTLPA